MELHLRKDGGEAGHAPNPSGASRVSLATSTGGHRTHAAGGGFARGTDAVVGALEQRGVDMGTEGASGHGGEYTTALEAQRRPPLTKKVGNIFRPPRL